MKASIIVIIFIIGYAVWGLGARMGYEYGRAKACVEFGGIWWGHICYTTLEFDDCKI